MRSTVTILVLTLLSVSALALEVRVTGSHGEQLFTAQSKMQIPAHVGDATLDLFEKFEVPFEGGSYGFSKIYNLGNDVVVISETEMKAYGWCFAVNGVAPDTMADQTPLQGNEQLIEWFYAYAHLKDGNWIGQCVRD